MSAMTTTTKASVPADPALDGMLHAFLEQCDTALGPTYCAVLFGSAARGEWLAGESNVNVLLVLDDAAPPVLRTLEYAFRTFAALSSEPPLLLSRAEWRDAADAFPLEIADMQVAYRVLRGDDPMPEVQPARSDLRRALEREFRGKLLQLRRGFAARSSDEAALGWLAARSAPTFVLLCRCALVLLGEPLPPNSAAVVQRAAVRLAFDAGPLTRALAERAHKEWRCPVSEFLSYLAAVEAAVRAVDQLPMED